MSTPESATFPQPDLGEWKKLLESSLGGKSFESVRHRIAGLTFDPLYPEATTAQRPGLVAGHTRLLAALRPGGDIELARARMDGLFLDSSWSLDDLQRLGTTDWSLHDTTLERAQQLKALGFAGTCFIENLAGEVTPADQVGLLGYATIDGARWEADGADAVRELSVMVGGVLEALRAGATTVHLRIALTPSVFETIAKRRALSLMLAKVATWWGSDVEVEVHGLSSARTFALHDAYTNILRAACSAFSGLVAGLDSLTVLPHDWRSASVDELSDRTAMNLPHVLIQESHLLRTLDAAGGSGYLEALTDAFARAAWTQVQEYEQAGGVRAAWKAHVAPAIDEQDRDAHRATRTRKSILVGVNDFIDEVQVQQARGEQVGSFLGTGWERLASRVAGTAVGIETLGDLRRHKARRDFVERLLRAGGFSPVDLGTRDDLRTVFLCGHDEDYGTVGLDAARALVDVGKRVIVAGRPGELAEAWREAGVKDFVYVGADVLTVLESIGGK